MEKKLKQREIDHIQSSDPMVIEFVKCLGLDPNELIRLVITLEGGKNVIVEETKFIRKSEVK
jgi:hypothetical protein